MTEPTSNHRVRLSHVLARYADATTRLKGSVTGAYHQIQRTEGLVGTTKVYRKTLEDSADQPAKTQLLQTRAYDVTRGLLKDMSELLDATATKDYANTVAKASVVVDGTVLLADAPPTLLLSLEKMFTDLRTYLSKLPVLSPDEVWHYDPNQKANVSEPTESTRVELVKEPLVLYPATEKHPAQTQIVENSKVVGVWTTTKYSGAVSLQDKDRMLERTQKLLDAIKAALHEANSLQTPDRHPARDLLGYVSEGVI